MDSFLVEQNGVADETIKDGIPEEWEAGVDHRPHLPLSKVGQGMYTLSPRLRKGMSMPPSNLNISKWQSAARKALGVDSSSLIASTIRNPSQESSSFSASTGEARVVAFGPDAEERTSESLSDEIPSELPQGIQHGPHGARAVSRRHDREISIESSENAAAYLTTLLKAAQAENAKNQQKLLQGQEEYENKVAALEKKYQEEHKQLEKRQLENYGELQNQFVELVQRHSELQTQHAEVEEKHAELQTQHVEVGDRHAELQTQHAELRERHSVLQTQHADVGERHAELQTQHVEVGDRHAELQTQHAELRERHSVLQAQHADIGERHVELQTKHAELGQRHSEVEAQGASAGNSVHERKIPNEDSAVPIPQLPPDWLQHMCIELRSAVRENVRQEFRQGASFHDSGIRTLPVQKRIMRHQTTYTVSSGERSSSIETDRKGSGDESVKSEVWDNQGDQRDADPLPSTSNAPKATEPDFSTRSPHFSKPVSECSSPGE